MVGVRPLEEHRVSDAQLASVRKIGEISCMSTEFSPLPGRLTHSLSKANSSAGVGTGQAPILAYKRFSPLVIISIPSNDLRQFKKQLRQTFFL